jgi:hypothetical protein
MFSANSGSSHTMVSAILEVAETIQCDYTNTRCFWRLTGIAKNIVLVPLKTSSDGILSLDDFNNLKTG